MNKEVKKDSTKKKTIKIKMIRSVSGATDVQRACIIGLGLRKIGQTRELEDSPSIRGMAKKVDHLVSII